MLLHFLQTVAQKEVKFVMLRVHLWSFSVKRKMWTVIFFNESLQLKESRNKEKRPPSQLRVLINC